MRTNFTFCFMCLCTCELVYTQIHMSIEQVLIGKCIRVHVVHINGSHRFNCKDWISPNV